MMAMLTFLTGDGVTESNQVTRVQVGAGNNLSVVEEGAV